MATADTEASATQRSGWLRRNWPTIATVLAVIGLADLFSQLIKWAWLIHVIVTKYAIVRAWLFGWLPFHIPPYLHDPIVLLLIFFSVTNVGVYQRTKGTFISYVIKNTSAERFESEMSKVVRVLAKFVVPVIFMYLFFAIHRWFFPIINEVADYLSIDEGITATILTILFVVAFFVLARVAELGPAIIRAMFGGAYLAWRWLLITAAIFVALVIVNEFYVKWLEPLAEH